MDDLARGLLALIRPEIEQLVDDRVKEGLGRFVAPRPDPWMTAHEAATYLGLSVAAIRQRAQRGTLPAHKDETRWIFRREEIDLCLLAGNLSERKTIVETAREREDLTTCSFCSKKEVEVEHLVRGPYVAICNECVSLARQVIEA